MNRESRAGPAPRQPLRPRQQGRPGVRRRRVPALLPGLLAAFVAVAPPSGVAAETTGSAPDTAGPAVSSAQLTELSLEELTKVQFVTSVAKKPQRLSDAAAAIAVVGGDAITHTPTTTIPDLLREVPGLFVGSVDAHTWAISSRGFNDAFGNKLLVLLDGRSVYTPLFSGVYWDVQDTVLEDLDRIEVVRGPGATMWGANAVNGVINLTTKHSKDTQGTLVSGGGGSEDLAIATVRHGGQLGSNAYYRVYAKYNQRDSSVLQNNPEHLADDRWRVFRTGFRADWDPNPQDRLTLQGDLYTGQEDQTYSFATLTPPAYRSTVSQPTDLFGANVLGRWSRTFGVSGELRLQTYYDHSQRDQVLLDEKRDTVDVDLQHRFNLGPHQEINWGAGYRFTQDELRDSFTLTFDRARRGDQLFSLFGQDELTLVPDHLHLTGGIKLEHNDYTGFEYQPRGSLHYAPGEHHALWASVSRAVRTPSRAEHDIRINDRVYGGAPPLVVSIFGNPAYRSETVLAYEAGYRFNPAPRFSADLALFYNEYRHLRTTEQVGGPDFDPSLPGTPLVQRVNLDNKSGGETYGAELALRYRLADWWELQGSYSALEMQLHATAGSNDADAELDEEKAPHHQFRLRSGWQLASDWRLDLIGRYVDAIADFNIPAYFELDARLAWRPRPNLEFSINGRNLLDDRHPEFWPTILGTQRTEVQRAVFGTMSYRF